MFLNQFSFANTVSSIFHEADHAVDLTSVLVLKIIAEPRCVPAEKELYGLYRAVCTDFRGTERHRAGSCQCSSDGPPVRSQSEVESERDCCENVVSRVSEVKSNNALPGLLSHHQGSRASSCLPSPQQRQER